MNSEANKEHCALCKSQKTQKGCLVLGYQGLFVVAIMPLYLGLWSSWSCSSSFAISVYKHLGELMVLSPVIACEPECFSDLITLVCCPHVFFRMWRLWKALMKGAKASDESQLVTHRWDWLLRGWLPPLKPALQNSQELLCFLPRCPQEQEELCKYPHNHLVVL